MAEGRLSRWSRLKSKGGADAREEAQVAEDNVRTEAARATPPNEFATLPGGMRVRNFVPAMAPLAPDAEDNDDRFTRGIGHAEPDDTVDGESDAAAAQAALEAEFAALPPDEEDLFAGIDEEELTDEQREVVEGLPPLDTLDKDSDFTPFMRDGVPEFLKRRALRVLWRVNPFFNFRDGLNDYDQDFNIIHKVIDELTGNYQVGRGFLSDKELRDMTPESTRRAFGDPETEEDEETQDAAPDEQTEAADIEEKTAKNEQPEPVADGDETGGGEDDPDL
ncbi:MAG: DUF3306 domain-containing protein [Rhodospirillales bacterium]|nr:DUF3306 domain-containing protein [Rhodospirillales bacterium]